MELKVRDLGRMRYSEAWDLQKEIHTAVATGREPPHLLLVEHPPVITLGRNAGRSSLLKPETWYRERNIDVHVIERGGDITWHGPGQLVGYLILPVGRRVRELFRRVERALLRVSESFGVEAGTDPELAGVWHGQDKLCAVGLAVRNRVSFHGFALNVTSDLAAFDTIGPCGIKGRGVTSLEKVMGTIPDMTLVKERTTTAIVEQFLDWPAAAGDPEASCRV
jgi:lipoyl(octanoyl) transferase